MTQKTKNKEAVRFGQLGGRAVSKDRAHMSEIGKRGARKRWKGHKKNKK